MRLRTSNLLNKLAIPFSIAVALCFWSLPLAFPQSMKEVYSATVIASEGAAGSSGRVSIRIASYTSDAEKASLLEAFKKDPESGVALLRTMSKGFIVVEEQTGRKIEAVFLKERQDGRELIVVTEHVASALEKWHGIRVEDYPLAVIHIRFGRDGSPVSGEIFPAVKVVVTPDGFVDAQSGGTNKVTMINIVRQ